MEDKKITIRDNGGKCHPAIVLASGGVMVCCRCPNSQNGRLANSARKIADGHEAVNCRIK